jgi:hypothetical protein
MADALAIDPVSATGGVDARRPPERRDGEPAQTERAPLDRVTVSAAARAITGAPLDAGQRVRVERLRAGDARVRAHERAHQAAGGAAAGAARFEYEVGPDGKQYAVAGEVPIRIETGPTPDATIANAERVRAAALAPADPSSQDLAVAAEAVAIAVAARAEKARGAQAGARAGARAALGRRAEAAYGRTAARTALARAAAPPAIAVRA